MLFTLALLTAGQAAAQQTIFFTDFRQLGRLDAPPGVGPLEPEQLMPTTDRYGGLVHLPDGEILAVGSSLARLDPQTLDLEAIVEGPGCVDATATGDGSVWCVTTFRVLRLAPGSYTVELDVEHPGLQFRAIAALGPAIYAVATPTGDAGFQLVEIDPLTGDVSILRPLSLPPSPIDGRSFGVDGMDFDDAGDLWLGLPLYLPSIVLPPPPDGYLVRILDPLGGAVAQEPQRLVGTTNPSPLVIGGPAVVAVPTGDARGTALLIALLVLSGLAIIVRRP